jgi:hypothetical protein
MGFLFASAIFAVGVIAVGIILLLTLIRAVFWLVFLPLKLIFAVLFVPVWLVKTAFRVVGLAIVAPIMLLAAIVGGALLVLGLIATLVVPLVPIAIVAGLLWLVIRTFGHRPVRVA